MNETLLERVRRYLEAHAEATGIAQTPMPGLTIIRATTVSGLQHGIPHPQACLVLQGSKEVTQGIHTQLLGRSPGRPWRASGAVAAPRPPGSGELAVAREHPGLLRLALLLELADGVALE